MHSKPIQPIAALRLISTLGHVRKENDKKVFTTVHNNHFFMMKKLHPVLLAQGTLRCRGAGSRSEAKTLADPQGKRPVVS